jgi:hypothetical protein
MTFVLKYHTLCFLALPSSWGVSVLWAIFGVAGISIGVVLLYCCYVPHWYVCICTVTHMHQLYKNNTQNTDAAQENVTCDILKQMSY